MSSQELLSRNGPPKPLSQTNSTIVDVDAITLTPDPPKRRRQKKNSKHKTTISSWDTTSPASLAKTLQTNKSTQPDVGLDLSEYNDNEENEQILENSFFDAESISRSVSTLKVMENSTKVLKSQHGNLVNERVPDAGKLALEKINKSSVLKMMINEDAAKATNINYNQHLYEDEYLVPVEDPGGEEAVIEAARQAKLAHAPMIVIPPKPEAKIGEPDLYSILPQDALSFSTPTFKNHYTIRPENKCISCSIEDSAFEVARIQELWQCDVSADL